LDVVFNAGNIVTQAGRPDLTVYLLSAPQGTTRIEASSDGTNYVIVGFMGVLPAQTPASCNSMATLTPTAQGMIASVALAACNTISNVTHLRLSADAGAMAIIDAIEALTVVKN
jgi:hypothetical protein